MNKKIDEIVNWLKNYLNSSNAKGFVLGISGGIDSAVLLAILEKYFNNQYVGYWIDVNSSSNDYNYFKLLVSKNNYKYEEINLNKTLEYFKNDLNLNDENEINVKSRLRMITLYAKAQELNYLVLGTTNLNEYMIGYFTKYGDSASDLAPLKDLLKSEIRDIAKILEIPKEIIDRDPSAGLYDGQTDEEEIGISYDDMDSYFLGKELPNDIKNNIENKIKFSEHKRSEIPYPKFKKDLSWKK